MNKRLLVLCNLNCVSSHLGCMGSGKLYEQLCASSTCEQYSLGSTQGNSQLAAVASSLTCLSSCSKANPQKKDGSREFPEGRNILVSISREKQNDRGHRNKSILWVPTENWAIVRRFHFTASFRIIIRRPPSALFPHQLPWFHTGERWKTKTQLMHTFEEFNFYKDFYYYHSI